MLSCASARFSSRFLASAAMRCSSFSRRGFFGTSDMNGSTRFLTSYLRRGQGGFASLALLLGVFCVPVQAMDHSVSGFLKTFNCASSNRIVSSFTNGTSRPIDWSAFCNPTNDSYTPGRISLPFFEPTANINPYLLGTSWVISRGKLPPSGVRFVGYMLTPHAINRFINCIAYICASVSATEATPTVGIYSSGLVSCRFWFKTGGAVSVCDFVSVLSNRIFSMRSFAAAADALATSARSLALPASALAFPARSFACAISPLAVSASFDSCAVALRSSSNLFSWRCACVTLNGRNSRSLTQCQIPRIDSPNTPIATSAAKTSTQVSRVRIADSTPDTAESADAMAASNSSSFVIEEGPDDEFFYVFVGSTILIGLIGLIWPACILTERFRQRK